MKKHLTPLLILLCCSFSSFAQKFYPATLHYADGKTASLLVKAPVGGDFIMVKASEEAKKEKINSGLLQRIEFNVENNEVVHYHYIAPKIAGKVKNKQWMQVLETGPVTLYAVGSSMMTAGPQGHKVTDVTYYARRKSEEHASFLGLDFTSGAIGVGVDKQFRKYAGEYFSDYRDLVTRIENKEFEISDAVLVVKEYNSWFGND